MKPTKTEKKKELTLSDVFLYELKDVENAKAFSKTCKVKQKKFNKSKRTKLGKKLSTRR